MGTPDGSDMAGGLAYSCAKWLSPTQLVSATLGASSQVVGSQAVQGSAGIQVSTLLVRTGGRACSPSACFPASFVFNLLTRLLLYFFV